MLGISEKKSFMTTLGKKDDDEQRAYLELRGAPKDDQNQWRSSEKNQLEKLGKSQRRISKKNKQRWSRKKMPLEALHGSRRRDELGSSEE